jgi:Rrf2 family transcriptional regulator, cysteine metabolism repressor
VFFTTKAEYGVRLMIALGRRGGDEPVALGAVAEVERLPLNYLERLVALLRKADLVHSTRGAHGGYRLARPAEQITMAEVVAALEGPLAPMECFTDAGVARIMCSHEADGDHACATKLLWTRVQLGMLGALQGTSLAELVAFSSRHDTRPLAGQVA